MSVKHGSLTPILAAIDTSDKEKNKSLDMQTLIGAFDNYTQMVSNKDASAGVPIHYFIKPITKSDIARLWLAKWEAAADEKLRSKNG